MPGSSKQTTKTDQKTDPWAPAQPGLQSILQRAGQYGQDTGMFTPTFSGYTQDAVAGLGNLGRQPSQAAGMYTTAANTAAGGLDTGYGVMAANARGDYLNANPYLDRVIGTTQQNTADAVNRQFSGMGRYGSGAHTGVLTKELGNIEANARLSNYNTERSNQNTAADNLARFGLGAGDIAGQASAAEAQRLGYLQSAGGLQDQMDASQREAPLRALEWQSGITNPIASLGQQTQGTQTQTVKPSMGQQIMGGAMMGLGLLTGNPMAAMGGMGSSYTPAPGGWGATTQPTALGWLTGRG
jgi:hypothetical protein